MLDIIEQVFLFITGLFMVEPFIYFVALLLLGGIITLLSGLMKGGYFND